jgi:hypothetical protein
MFSRKSYWWIFSPLSFDIIIAALFIGGNNLFVLQEKLLVDISATIF